MKVADQARLRLRDWQLLSRERRIALPAAQYHARTAGCARARMLDRLMSNMSTMVASP